MGKLNYQKVQKFLDTHARARPRTPQKKTTDSVGSSRRLNDFFTHARALERTPQKTTDSVGSSR